MCVLYVERPRTFWCVAMGSAVLFILRSRLLLYSTGSRVNIVQVVLSGFSVRLFCFVQAKIVCRYGCIYFMINVLYYSLDFCFCFMFPQTKC